ncbi:MAG TPA: hypothetical protein VEU33_45385 [Archangium sp.]|nr:hypothetical protein [Archangium sp.]
MPGRLLMLLLLLAVETACPHAFGRGGTIDMAVRKQIEDSWRRPGCWMEKEYWMAVCGKNFWSKPDDEKKQCPEECRPSRERW